MGGGFFLGGFFGVCFFGVGLGFEVNDLKLEGALIRTSGRSTWLAIKQ